MLFRTLQWGRGGEAAESPAALSAREREGRSFNGAAAVRPRKEPDRGAAISTLHAASMGPRR